MAVTRFQIAANKKSALSKQQIREIAKLLAEQPNPKEEKARIKAESLIRDDNTIEAYEILQLTCELLAERINLISHSRDCPQDLIGSISTLIWASAIVDIPELIEVRKQFQYKYGKQFDADAMANVGGVINERVAAKLSVQPPSAFLVQTYLEKIADEHQVSWKPKVPLSADTMAEPMAAPIGYSVPVGGGSGLNTSQYTSTNNTIQNQNASAPPMSPTFVIPPEAPSNANPNGVTSTMKKQSAYVPALPTSSVPPTKIDDIEEEIDIFVPGAPTVPPGESISKRDNKHDKNEDDDDESGGGGGGEQTNKGGAYVVPSSANNDSGGADESYDDLAARFAMLQR